MAMGFIMKQSIRILHLEDEKDAMRAQRAVFTGRETVSCYFCVLKQENQQQDPGLQERVDAIAITPVLASEPEYLQHEDKVFKVLEVSKHTGFGMDHWEIKLRQFTGQAVVQ